MADNKKTMTFRRGQVIAAENEAGGDLYVIESGVAEVFRARGNEEIRLALLGPGEMIGSMTVLDGGARAATVRAKSDVQVVYIDKEKVRQLAEQLPKWASALIADLTLRVKQADDLYQSAHLGEIRPETDLPGLGKYLRMSVIFAEKFFDAAKQLATQNNGGIVNVSDVVDKLKSEHKWDESDIKSLCQVLEQCQLAPWSNKDRRCRLTATGAFSHFAGFVRRLHEEQILESVVGVVMASGRKMLEKIARATAIDNKGSADNKTDAVTVRLIDIDAAMANIGEPPIDMQVIRQAAFLELLEETKVEGAPGVRLVPQKLLLDVLCLDAIIQLDQLNAPAERLKVKRTLVY